jgi:hypothetical protein
VAFEVDRLDKQLLGKKAIEVEILKKALALYGNP